MTRGTAGPLSIGRRVPGRRAIAAAALAATLLGEPRAGPRGRGQHGESGGERDGGRRPVAASAGATVVTRGYDLGRAQLSVLGADGRPHRLPTRLVGEISIRAGATGRLPVVVILHGAHQSCAEGPGGTVSSDYPCLPGWEPVEIAHRLSVPR